MRKRAAKRDSGADRADPETIVEELKMLQLFFFSVTTLHALVGKDDCRKLCYLFIS